MFDVNIADLITLSGTDSMKSGLVIKQSPCTVGIGTYGEDCSKKNGHDQGLTKRVFGGPRQP